MFKKYIYIERRMRYFCDYDLHDVLNHIRPSYKPSPLMAEHGCIYQTRSFNVNKPKRSCNWSGLSALKKKKAYYKIYKIY